MVTEDSSLYDRLRRMGLGAWSIIGLLGLVAILVWAAIRLRIIWPPLIFAIIIIYVLKPLVDLLRRLKIPRVVGSFIAYLLFGGLALFLIGLAAPLVGAQWADLVDRLPEAVDSINNYITNVMSFFNISFNFEGLDSLVDRAREWLSDPANRDVILNSLGWVWNFARGVIHVVAVAVLAPVLAFYILVDAPNLHRAAHRMLPSAHREEMLYLFRQIGRTVGGFIRGQLLVALIVGVFSSITLWVLNLPFWLIVGMMAGLLNIIPFIGPWVGGVLGVSTALVVGEPVKALWVGLAFLLIQQVDNHLISPLVLRVAVHLSPATIVLSLLAGGSLGGVFGVLIAVPFTGVLKVVAGHLWRTRGLGEPWDQALTGIVVEREAEPIKQRVRRVSDRLTGESPVVGEAPGAADGSENETPSAGETSSPE